MMKLLLATALTALTATVYTASANAQIFEKITALTVTQDATLTQSIPARTAKTPVLNLKSTIGIARLDKGRLIYAPVGELRDWAFLDKRSAATFAPVSPAALLRNIPEVPMMGGKDSDNKLDEIRLTASDLHMDYVLVYGMGADAQWGSFAGKALANTGFIIDSKTMSPRAPAKAMLVNTYTGQVYGTVTSDEIEFGVGDLTDKVEILINQLSAKRSVKMA